MANSSKSLKAYDFVTYTTGEPMVIIRMDYMRMTDEDHCASALMNYFAFKAECLLQTHPKLAPWHVATYLEIEQGLCNHYSYRTIKEALDKISKWGYVKMVLPTRTEPGRFLFDVPLVKQAIANRAPMEVVDNTGSVILQDGSRRFDILPPDEAKRFDETTPTNCNFAGPYKEETSERCTSEDVQPPIPPAEDEEQEMAFLEGEDAYLRVRLALSKHRGFDPNQSEKRKLKANLAEHHIRADLVSPVVDRFVEWAKKQTKEIPPSCVASKTFLALLMGEESLDVDKQPAESRGFTPHKTLPPSPPTSLPVATNGLPALAKRWNEVVKSGPPILAWDRDSEMAKALSSLEKNPSFQEQVETMLMKVERLCAAKHEKGGFMSLSWILKKPGRWSEILNGEKDWMLGDGPAQKKKSPIDLLMADLDAKIAANKDDKNVDSQVQESRLDLEGE